MGHYEDSFFEIHNEVESLNLKEQFDKQLSKNVIVTGKRYYP